MIINALSMKKLRIYRLFLRICLWQLIAIKQSCLTILEKKKTLDNHLSRLIYKVSGMISSSNFRRMVAQALGQIHLVKTKLTKESNVSLLPSTKRKLLQISSRAKRLTWQVSQLRQWGRTEECIILTGSHFVILRL